MISVNHNNMQKVTVIIIKMWNQNPATRSKKSFQFHFKIGKKYWNVQKIFPL